MNAQIILKDVLLPFVISIFLVYLLRPLVNILTTPFGRVCPCCVTPGVPGAGGAAAARRARGRAG
jgi:hypothetical protein